MKRTICFILALVMCMSLVACGNKDEVQSIVVDGQETSVKVFLIENLGNYIKSDSFLKSQQNFQDIMGSEPAPLKVTRVIELELDGKETNSIDIHYLAVKADCQWAKENGDLFNDTLLIVDYETGIVYDQSMVDESWFKDDGSKESWTYIMLNGPLCGEGYDGGTIIADAETRRELSTKEIAEINEALHK